MIVIRLAAPLFFANGVVFTQAVQRAVRAAPAGDVHSLVVDMEAVTDVDVTGAESFAALKEWLAQEHIALSFSRVRSEARERLILFGLLAGEAVYPTNRAAVEALTPPVGWWEKIRDGSSRRHTRDADRGAGTDADERDTNGPSTGPVQITRSSN